MIRVAIPAILVVLGLAAVLSAGDGLDLLKQAEEAFRKDDRKKALELAEEALAKDPKNLFLLAARAELYERMDEYLWAVRDWTRVLDTEPKNARAYQRRGMLNFKGGKIDASIKDFDQYIDLEPTAKVSHWQRGISYYYAGKFALGVEQFEGYQTFDSNDAENAVWRCMCQAKLIGLAKAQKDLLKIGDDRRVPMRQIYEMFAGNMKPEEVLDVATKTNAKNEKAVYNQLFYAHLYVGIWFDLLGEKGKAFDHLDRATEKHRIGHYMWDVARVHRDLLKLEKK